MSPEDADLFRLAKLKTYNSLPNMINGSSGSSEWLATTSILSVVDSYIADIAYSGTAYVIADYDGEQPSVICSFAMNDVVTTVSASYVKEVEVSADDITRVLGELLPLDTADVTTTVYTQEMLRKLYID